MPAGKTSVTRAVRYGLSRADLRVLLIDLEPQANLTSRLVVQEARMDRTVQWMFNDQGLAEYFDGFGLHLIPSAGDLALVEAAMLSIPGAQMHLRQVLQRLPDQYDVVSRSQICGQVRLAGLTGVSRSQQFEDSKKGTCSTGIPNVPSERDLTHGARSPLPATMWSCSRCASTGAPSS